MPKTPCWMERTGLTVMKIRLLEPWVIHANPRCTATTFWMTSTTKKRRTTSIPKGMKAWTPVTTKRTRRTRKFILLKRNKRLLQRSPNLAPPGGLELSDLTLPISRRTKGHAFRLANQSKPRLFRNPNLYRRTRLLCSTTRNCPRVARSMFCLDSIS